MPWERSKAARRRVRGSGGRRRQRRWFIVALHVTALVLAGRAADTVVTSLSSRLDERQRLAAAGILLATTLLGYLMASSRDSIATAQATSQPARRIWRSQVLSAAAIFAAGAGAAMVGVLLIHSNAWILALVVPLLYLGLHTYRAHNESVRTERRAVLDLLEAAQRSEQRYALAAAGSNDGLWDWDITGDSLYCSERWKAMLGLLADESVASLEQWLRHVVEEDRDALRTALDAHRLAPTSHLACEYRVRHRNGEVRDMLCRGMAVRDDLGQAVRMAGSQTDVTESRRIQDGLAQAARLDPLTGLPNRTHFGELAQRQIAQSRRVHASGYAVLFIDLDEFKLVNDSLGHVSGDELLVGIAQRLTASLREGDMLARFGGDEFVVLATNISGADDVRRVAERMQRALAEPFLLKSQEVYMSASIGIVVGKPDYATVAELLADADTAMYRAKASARGTFALFDATMNVSATDRLSVEAERRGADEPNALVA